MKCGNSMQAATVGGLLSFAQASAGSNPDPSVKGALASGYSSDFLPTAAAAMANLNSQADAATNAADVEKTAYYAQAVVRVGLHGSASALWGPEPAILLHAGRTAIGLSPGHR